jgi:hypothetical protein
MYHCALCNAVTPPAVSHTILERRPNGSIAKELKVCKDCKEAEIKGLSTTQIQNMNRRKRRELETIPKMNLIT